MKKRGFTLIELLAVIIILSIVAMIATPLVTNLIKGSSSSTDEVNAKRYIEAVKLALTNRELDGEKYLSSCVLKDGVLTCDDTEALDLDIKGKYPIEGNLTLERSNVIGALLKYNGNEYLLYLGDDNKIIKLEDTSNLVTVTFDANGGELVQDTKQVLPNESYGYLPIPTRDGYEFLGWTNGVNLAPDLSAWTLTGGATYDPIEKTIYLPNLNSVATSPMIYVGDTQINTLKTYKLNATIRGTADNTGYLAGAQYYNASKSQYSSNGNAHEINQEWTKYSLGIAGSTQISSGVCSYITFTFNRSTQYAEQPYYVKNVDLRVQNEAIDKYEPFYTTPDSKVVKTTLHTLKAAWKEIN